MTRQSTETMGCGSVAVPLLLGCRHPRRSRERLGEEVMEEKLPPHRGAEGAAGLGELDAIFPKPPLGKALGTAHNQ